MDFWSDARAEVGFFAYEVSVRGLQYSYIATYLWLLSLLEESVLALLRLGLLLSHKVLWLRDLV